MKNEESRCAQNEESLLEAGLRHNSSFLILHSSLMCASRTLIPIYRINYIYLSKSQELNDITFEELSQYLCVYGSH